MLIPLRAGNSNRSDLQAITNSLLNARGTALTKDQGSIIWIETVAWARAIYNIWAANTTFKNQFDPAKMSVFLQRWQKIYQLFPLSSNYSISQQRMQIAAKLGIFNKNPTTQQIIDLMELFLGDVFLDLKNISAGESLLSFVPNGPLNIQGGENCGNGSILPWGSWQSEVSSTIIETVNPGIPTNEYNNIRNQIFNLLNTYLPSWVGIGYAVNVGFSDDGYAGGPGFRATVSTILGGNTITGVGTAWATPLASGEFDVKAGSILQFFDDNGQYQKYTVTTVNSNTSVTVAQTTTKATSKLYLIYGFFLDCDPNSFPYPPTGALNLDAAPFGF